MRWLIHLKLATDRFKLCWHLKNAPRAHNYAGHLIHLIPLNCYRTIVRTINDVWRADGDQLSSCNASSSHTNITQLIYKTTV